jgi:hypothetical protein
MTIIIKAKTNETTVQTGPIKPVAVVIGQYSGNHGSLAGLSNDDHPQYLNNARGDARYVGQINTVQSNLDAHKADVANPHATTKIQVGLSNVDNTSDANKPVSTAQGIAIAVVQADIDAHQADLANPHAVTKAQVGLSSVDNTSDATKPVSSAQAAAIATKAPLVHQHALSDLLQSGAATNQVPQWNGSAWLPATISGGGGGGGDMLSTNNLSDVASVSSSRTNLNVPSKQEAIAYAYYLG